MAQGAGGMMTPETTTHENTRAYWRGQAYRLQEAINRRKTGQTMVVTPTERTMVNLYDLIPKREEPTDSGRGSMEDWQKLCGLLVRYAKAYTTGKPPSLKTIDGIERLRAKMWD